MLSILNSAQTGISSPIQCYDSINQKKLTIKFLLCSLLCLGQSTPQLQQGYSMLDLDQLDLSTLTTFPEGSQLPFADWHLFLVGCAQICTSMFQCSSIQQKWEEAV